MDGMGWMALLDSAGRKGEMAMGRDGRRGEGTDRWSYGIGSGSSECEMNEWDDVPPYMEMISMIPMTPMILTPR